MIREIFKGYHNAAAARKLRRKQTSALSGVLNYVIYVGDVTPQTFSIFNQYLNILCGYHRFYLHETKSEISDYHSQHCCESTISDSTFTY